MIDGLPVLGIGQSGLLALVVLFILTDRLVWHKRLEAKDLELETVRERADTLMAQNTLLLESLIPTVNGVLDALRDEARERSS